jgi:hypothetical protein
MRTGCFYLIFKHPNKSPQLQTTIASGLFGAVRPDSAGEPGHP